MQVIPEIGWTHPPGANVADYRRELYHNPSGPTRYHSAVPLASPSISSSRSITRPTLEIPASTPIVSTRRLPIHSGPTNRNSGSSSSSDFSSNRRTTNTSPSISPARGTNVKGLPSERTREVKLEAPSTAGTLSALPSQYAPYSGQAQHPVRYGTYGYEQPQAYRVASPAYANSMPTTPSAPVFKVAAPSYGGYPAPPLDMPGYPGPNGQPLYIDNFQPPDGERRSKKRRGNLPKWQTDFMRAWYNDHVDNPYPNDEEKHMIVRETGLTLEQVSHIFHSSQAVYLPLSSGCQLVHQLQTTTRAGDDPASAGRVKYQKNSWSEWPGFEPSCALTSSGTVRETGASMIFQFPLRFGRYCRILLRMSSRRIRLAGWIHRTSNCGIGCRT